MLDKHGNMTQTCSNTTTYQSSHRNQEPTAVLFESDSTTPEHVTQVNIFVFNRGIITRMYLVKLFLQAFHWPKLGHFVADVPGSRVEVSPGPIQLRHCTKCTPAVRNYLRHTRKTSQAFRNVPVLLQRMKREACFSQPFIQGGNPTYDNVVGGERWGGLVKIWNERGTNTTKYNLIETNWPKQRGCW
jgi:hypothetical protein